MSIKKKKWGRKRFGSADFSRAIANRKLVRLRKLKQEEAEARAILKSRFFRR